MWVIQSFSENDFDHNDQNEGNALNISGKATNKSYVIKSVTIYYVYLTIFPGFWPPIISSYQIFIITIIIVHYYLRKKVKTKQDVL